MNNMEPKMHKTEDKKIKRTSIVLTEEEYKRVNELINKGVFRSLHDLIRNAINNYFDAFFEITDVSITFKGIRLAMISQETYNNFLQILKDKGVDLRELGRYVGSRNRMWFTTLVGVDGTNLKELVNVYSAVFKGRGKIHLNEDVGSISVENPFIAEPEWVRGVLEGTLSVVLEPIYIASSVYVFKIVKEHGETKQTEEKE